MGRTLEHYLLLAAKPADPLKRLLSCHAGIEEELLEGVIERIVTGAAETPPGQ